MTKTVCNCVCHGHGEAHKPPCSIPGGCGHLHEAHHRASRTAGHTEVLTAPRCVLPHKGKKLTATVGLVCEEHLASLRDELANILDGWAELPYVNHPLAVRGGRNSESKHTKSPYPPAPTNLTALALTDRRTNALGAVTRSSYRNGHHLESNGPDVPDLIAVLADWATMIATDRPADLTGLSVTQAVETIRENLTWAVTQDWVVDLEAELRACRRSLAAAVGEQPGPPPLCTCPYCGSDVWTDRDREIIRLRRQNVDPAAASAPYDRVLCTGCNRAWNGGQELRRLKLASEVEQRRRKADQESRLRKQAQPDGGGIAV